MLTYISLEMTEVDCPSLFCFNTEYVVKLEDTWEDRETWGF